MSDTDSAAVFEDITYERRERTAWITLARPRDLNAMGPRMVAELSAAFRSAAKDDEVVCIVLTGEGRAFCAGADLKFANEFDEAEREQGILTFLRDASAMMAFVEAVPKPVIAMVNGVALAGGLELILCCDLVIAGEDARIGDGHANYGLLPGAGGTVRLPLKVGLSAAKYLLFTGDLFDAAHMQAIGLVNTVFPKDELAAAVEAIAQNIGRKSPYGLRLMKRLANGTADGTVEEAMLRELAANAEHLNSYDRNEGLTAFSERRAPMFLGR